MKKEIKFLLIILSILFLVNVVNAAEDIHMDVENVHRLDFGHVMKISSLSIEPDLRLGGDSVLKIIIENTANFPISDIRVDITLPSEISFRDDVSRRKIPRLESGKKMIVNYNIIAHPDISEGVYDGNLVVEYVNHIGYERQDNDTFGIIISGQPTFFAKVDDSEIYKGNDIGEVTLTFVNNDIADIKFLTVELLESEDYDILSPSKDYIGDLDSDDFESSSFRLRINSDEKQVPLILKVDYRDTINNFYSNKMDVAFPIRTAEELGIKQSNNYIIIIVIVVIVVGYYFYRRYKKKKKTEKKF